MYHHLCVFSHIYRLISVWFWSQEVLINFLICIVRGGVQTGSTRHVGHLLAYCTCPGWLWSWRIWWIEWQGKPKYSEKTCPGATLSTTNPTWPDPELNPGRRGGKPGLTASAMARPDLERDTVVCCAALTLSAWMFSWDVWCAEGESEKTAMSCWTKGTLVKPVYNLPSGDYFSLAFI
jgi:hypothetical protein